MKPFERESFLKSLLLYFITIELLIGFLLYHSYHEEVDNLKQHLFLEMKNYNFDFKGDKFDIDFVPKTTARKLLELEENGKELYVFFPLHGNEKYTLKIFYDRRKFDAQIHSVLHRYLLYMLLLTLIVAGISFGFARYTLRPLRRALDLMDGFIKDIIHDLNTPVSAILVNTAMLPAENKAARRIKKSAETIGMLYRNLQEYQHHLPQQRERFALDTLTRERVDFFRGLYPALTFDLQIGPATVTASRDAVTRILDNLLSNACKYNTGKGTVAVRLEGSVLNIENDTHGALRHPEKLFDRFYKESERGIGIGLHIVKKLCSEEHIGISLTQKKNRVVFRIDFSETAAS